LIYILFRLQTYACDVTWPLRFGYEKIKICSFGKQSTEWKWLHL